MKDIREIHNEAMYWAEMGDIKKFEGNKNESIELYARAYELEKEAATIALESHFGEPTTSILLKSAASLAMRCRLNRDAEKLIGLALSGEPPMDIVEELRDMLENVNFDRHLSLKGVTLHENEVQLVIAGSGVGFGYAKSDDALDRVDTYKKLAIRTIERKAGRIFRTAGKIPNELKDVCQSFITAPRAASMAFRIKFGSLADSQFQGFNSFEDIIEDINDNIELIGRGDLDNLRMNIKDESYFNNFVGLTKQLAPDGDDIKLFGITSILNGKERRVQLTSKKSEISSIIEKTEYSYEEQARGNKTIEKNAITGVLSAADNLGKVKITSSDGERTTIIVPDGLADIVKTYWEEEVTIRFKSSGKSKKTLIDIDKIG